MNHDKTAKIKAAVRGNFEQSPVRYQQFEDQWRFFRRLNETLVARMRLPEEPLVLDVGCGTGASCRQILDALPRSRVWGIDISAAMLEAARSASSGSDRLTLIEGDAARLEEYFDFRFHAVIYSASIFLVPDYETSLVQARDLLADDGCVGLTFMDGLYDREGNNLFVVADQTAGLGVSLRRPVKFAGFQAFFEQTFPASETWKEDFVLPDGLLRDFFSVPAMSAGLFPGLAYAERVEKVGILFDRMPETEKLFRWAMMIGRRRGEERGEAG